jgi:glycosyltransferase involved in cell wall biosynthesis
MEIAIISSGILPIPPTQGGAVENLIKLFVEKNEEYKKAEITVFSIYENRAREESKKYIYTKVIYIKPLLVIKLFDIIIYQIAKNILRVDKNISYQCISQRIFFLNKVSIYLKRNNFDKILLENNPTTFLSLKWRKNYKKYKGNYYYHLHNELIYTFGCSKLIKNTSNIICVSNYIANQISKKLNTVDNISVLKNCIDHSKFKIQISDEIKNALREKYKIQNDERVLLFAGRLTKEKGVKELLLSLQNIQYKNYKLLVIGSAFFGTKIKNKYEKEIIEAIRPIKNKVILTGFVDYEEIPYLYNIADLSIVPSIWKDPAPLVIIESLSAGLAIITTETGGIPEYVNELCAFIIKINSNLINNLTITIDKILHNNNLLSRMKKESLLTSDKYTLDDYYFNLISLLMQNNGQ